MTKKYWTTPPGELLTDTPENKLECIDPNILADFLINAGIKCGMICTGASPQIVQYDITLSDIYSYNKTKIKKALEMFSARYHVNATIDHGSRGDFSVIIPRTPRADLYLKSCLYTNKWNKASRTSCAAGVTTDNNVMIIDMLKAPHILISGETGSGKSVLLNSLIVSLLYKTTPADGQFLMIDPKQVELSLYNDLPHLYKPIVTDATKAVDTLGEVCEEMTRRYSVLSSHGVKQLSDDPELFPRLYVVIDELADLMLTSRKAVEKNIVRIAQLGRAAGIHLIIATQRPTTNIITGLIKANIPTKIALAVSNISDSITILNHGGAEKLTGRGDAIVKPSDSMFEYRIQSAFVPSVDIRRVVNYYKSYKQYFDID